MSSEQTLYDRLGGVFAIAAVVDYFSDRILEHPMVGKESPNPQLKEWSNNQLDRLPGLKFMRTLWVCAAAGGPQQYVATKPGETPMGLENAHHDLHITSEEFDAVAGVLSDTLDHFGVPEPEKTQVLGAFAAHKGEVIAGAQSAAA